jgi:DNA-nicking Smr family endonuclease
MSAPSDDEKELFIKQMVGVKPLKKSNKIKPIKKLMSQGPTPKKMEPEIHAIPIQESKTVILKPIKTHKRFKEGVTINPNIQVEEHITSQSILSFGLERLSSAHQQKITKGQIQIDAKIDLHGLERYEAQQHLHRFLDHAHAHHRRNLLIIHGKGSRHGETPILKQHLYQWIKYYPHLLALHTAHSKHGGTGAMYVILKNVLNK